MIRERSLRRGSGIAIAVALHVIVIYFIATTLGIVKAPAFVEPMVASIIEAPQQNEPLQPEMVKPDLSEPTLDVPVPDAIPEVEVPIEEPVMAESAISAPVSNAVETADMKVSRRVEPVYPPASRRLGEEGTGLFRVLVDERGRPIEVSVLRSSGFARLDESAMAAIRKWTFAPAVQAGAPVRSWTRVQVKFQLNT